MIVFRILSGGKEGKIVKSDLDVIYAGRKPECILQLDPYQDLSVHGQHAKIYKSNGFYYLEDLNSKNGTFVNEQAIKTPIQLKQGLVFRLGVDGPEIEVYDCKVQQQAKSSPPTENTFLLKRLDTDTVFNFDKKSVRLGRQPDCELALDPLKNREVSGYHALICCRDDGYYLEDLQSANGTFLNGVICKNSKLQNLDVVQLGKEGPKFQFLYQGQSEYSTTKVLENIPPSIPNAPIVQSPLETADSEIIIVEEEEVEAETLPTNIPQAKIPTIKAQKKTKPHRKNNDLIGQVKQQLQNFSKKIQKNNHSNALLNYVQKYPKESAVISIVLIFTLLWILVGLFSQSTYSKEELYTNFNETVVPVYSRYLVRINGKTLRGQIYSSGVLYHKNGKTSVITLRNNIYPWENQKTSQDKVEKLIHVVAIWPNHVPIFDNSLGYDTLDFSNSYNNDYTRIGGKDIEKIQDHSQKTCKITINKVIPFALSKNDVLINAQQTDTEVKVFSIYANPKEGINNDGTLQKVVTEGIAKNTNLNISCKSQGAPIFNSYGEIIGVYFDSNLVPIKY